MDISASVPLKVLVIDNTCGKHIHDLLPEDDPLAAAREFCTPLYVQSVFYFFL
ncbi:TPA: hypothetical protein G9F26_003966 [Salmonella enterica]|uniref:Plasmid conjugative transfer protein PilI domain-containing protein n=1 Tax=Salmonella enterica TaxID=28901 RepID=A0A750I1Q2_SALER|nr:hypothetical protein [Salmonella enterica]